MKTIAWPENLDKDGEYSEYLDLSQAIMFVSDIEKVATVTEKMTADESTLDFNQEVRPDDVEVLGINFKLGFWANGHLKNKGKKAMSYEEEGSTMFTIDLSDEALQLKFNQLCSDPSLGLANFVKYCYTANAYEIID